MLIVHLTASTFFGGPERQMLGLARALADSGGERTAFLSFSEGGRCRAFLDRAGTEGFESLELEYDTPHFPRVVRELTSRLKRLGADVLCCHGYKADILGRPAAKRAGIPAVAVSRGWTAEDRKVRLYEWLDRVALQWMDRVVCVSEGQAAKVRRFGVPARRTVVIRNAVRPDRFRAPAPDGREELRSLFPKPPVLVVGAAGRLSPEKGFGVFIDAAAAVAETVPSAGFIVFGEGPLRGELERRVADRGMGGRFLLAGFRPDLDRLMPHLDLMVLPSFTEGLPNVVLEAFAAGVPVVATAAGGTPEVVRDGQGGYLVPPGDPAPMARRIAQLLDPGLDRRAIGALGRERVLRDFTFEAQAERYRALFASLRRRTTACQTC
jgi:glycosyltransferase involved in cell wall biosynthesis